MHGVCPVVGEVWQLRSDAREPLRGILVTLIAVWHDAARGCRVGAHVVGSSSYALPLVDELGERVR